MRAARIQPFAFLAAYVGKPPIGCRLEIVEHEHDLGVYATIGIRWDVGTLGEEEWRYYRCCEEALRRLDDAVDWSSLANILWVSEGNPDEETDEQKTVED